MSERLSPGTDRLRSTILEVQRLELSRSRARDVAREALARDGWGSGRPRPRRRTQWLMGGLCLAGAATALALLIVRGGRDLTFSVPGASAAARTGQVMAPPAVAVPLVFSDGSSFTLAGGSQLHVAATSSSGARLVLHQGGVSASVVRGRRSRWSVAAGPFTVTVTGTRFQVSWDPGAGVFSLEVTEGSVIADGVLLRGGRPVTAGHRVTVSLGDQSVRWDGDPATAAPVPVAPPAPAGAGGQPREDQPAVESPPQSAGATSAARGRGGSAGFAWKELVLAERYIDAVRVAEGRGFPRVCREAASADLVLLGNAARYASSYRRASEAFTAVRQRFPGSTDAAVAAFALGRLAQDQRQDYDAAARWLEAYLRELPSGELAREASGRLVEVRWKEGDREGARAAARRYLAEHPNGPHATLSRSILNR